MGLNLADELLLLVYDDAGAPQAGKQAVDFGLAGALLMELMLAGRLAAPDQRVVVTDPSPTGDPLTDQALARRPPPRWPRPPPTTIITS